MWRAKALERKLEHQRLHPDYQYSPRKPGVKKTRKTKKGKATSYSNVPKDYANWNVFTEENTGMEFIDHHATIWSSHPSDPTTTAQEAIRSTVHEGARDFHWNGDRDVGLIMPAASHVSIPKAVDAHNFRADHPDDTAEDIDDDFESFEFTQIAPAVTSAQVWDTTPNETLNSQSWGVSTLDWDRLEADLRETQRSTAAEMTSLIHVETGNQYLNLSEEHTQTNLATSINDFKDVPQSQEWLGNNDI